jgi:hypothetical protein
MKGKNIEVNGIEITDIEYGAQLFGNVKIMSAGFYYIVNSTDFLIKWDGGKFKFKIIF